VLQAEQLNRITKPTAFKMLAQRIALPPAIIIFPYYSGREVKKRGEGTRKL
jgi:hypothetical protein